MAVFGHLWPVLRVLLAAYRHFFCPCHINHLIPLTFALPQWGKLPAILWLYVGHSLMSGTYQYGGALWLNLTAVAGTLIIEAKVLSLRIAKPV